LRICRLVWSFPRAEKISYGLGPNFYYISREQVAQGYEVNVIARRGVNEPSYEEIDGIKVHRVSSPYNMNAMKELVRLNSYKPFDIVHAHGTCGISYPLFRFRVRKPLVVHTHGTALGMALHRFSPSAAVSFKDSLKSKLRESIAIFRQKAYWKSADMLLAVSYFLKNEIEKLYNIDGSKIEVAYNGVDVSVFRKTDSSDESKKLGLEGKRIILYVGHFGLRKGIIYLIEAMHEILREEPDAFLLCVGGTPEWLGTDVYWRILKERIERVGIEKSVRLMGQVPHQKLPVYYSMADVFAFPSLYEAMGKVIVEAMACETPVVASRAGGIVEIVNDGINGFLVQPKDVKSLSQSILTVLQDSQLAKRLSEKGRETVETRFTWKHTVKQISKAYQKLISSGVELYS
jgi:glycosyltransferase involved in cell wall biosynthesis